LAAVNTLTPHHPHPPQIIGEEMHIQVASHKYKLSGRMTFCKNICNVFNLDIMINHLLPNQMIVNLYEFCSCIKYRLEAMAIASILSHHKLEDVGNVIFNSCKII